MEKEKTYKRHWHEPSEVPSIKLVIINGNAEPEEVEIYTGGWQDVLRRRNVTQWAYADELDNNARCVELETINETLESLSEEIKKLSKAVRGEANVGENATASAKELPPALFQRIEDNWLDLSTNTINRLKDRGLFYVFQVAMLSCSEVRKIRRIGKKGISEIEKLLYGHSLSFSMDLNEEECLRIVRSQRTAD